MRIPIRRISLGFAVLATAGCEGRESRVALPQSAAYPIAAGSTIDSLLPVDESLRRFRQGLPVATGFDDAAPSVDSLVAAVLGALERGDTAVLRKLAVSRGEYAHLYYPSSAYARKPYELAPDVAWMLSSQSGDKGRTRLVQRLGGRTLRSTGYECGEPRSEEGNRIWRACRVSFIDPSTSAAVTRKLFGSIIERDGQFKLLSFANDF